MAESTGNTDTAGNARSETSDTRGRYSDRGSSSSSDRITTGSAVATRLGGANLDLRCFGSPTIFSTTGDLPAFYFSFTGAPLEAWNKASAGLYLSAGPAHYHTVWFRISCAAGLLAMLGALCRLRLKHLERQFNMQLDARVGERTRIARELHDTLLQNFQGVLLKFHAVTEMLADCPAEARQLKEVMDQAERAITEGRNAVQGLRASTLVTNDLAQQISALGEHLIANQPVREAPSLRVEVDGSTRDLIPLVRDEIYRVAREALLNAFQHAQAGRIDVEIRYDRRQFRLWISDDGKGIDATVLAEGERAGHFGMTGMRERAGLAGGKLAIRSKPDAGTDVELTIPASRAYTKTQLGRTPLFTRP
jgi:signal transduction histidine kinase